MNVVFDFSGVLFDWNPAALVARMLPSRVRDEAEAARLAHEVFQGFSGDWVDFDRGTVEVDALVARIARRSGLGVHEVKAVVEAVPHELQPKVDTVALLRDLKERGHHVHFLSNMPAPYADHLDRTHDFVGWFESGLYSGRVGFIKPEPAIFGLALERFGARAGDCVLLDDHRPNVESARALGWAAVHYTGAASARAGLDALLDFSLYPGT